MATFTLYDVQVKDYIEKKNGLSYLSWAYAWKEVKKIYPKANFKVIHNKDGWNYHTDGKTCWVEVEFSPDGEETYEEYLPVMDYRNQAIPFDKVTSMDVNKALQRAKAKVIATATGLGICLYYGEDIPDEAEEKPKDIICADCGKKVIPFAKGDRTYTAEEIAATSESVYGRKLCWGCSMKAKAKKNESTAT